MLFIFQSDIPVGSLLMKTVRRKDMTVCNRLKDDTKKCFVDLSQGWRLIRMAFRNLI